MDCKKKTKVLKYEIWNGENIQCIQDFIGDVGVVKGIYVEIGRCEIISIASIGDYIVKNDWGRIEAIKPDVFNMLYDKIEDISQSNIETISTNI